MNEQTNVQIFFHLLIKRDDHHKRGEDCTREIQYCLALLMRNNFQRAVIWLNGHANAFDWRWHYLKLTIKKRRKKQTTAIWPNRESLICKRSQLRTRLKQGCYCVKAWYANVLNRKNKGAIAINHGECIFQRFWNCIAITTWNEMKSEMMKDLAAILSYVW